MNALCRTHSIFIYGLTDTGTFFFAYNLGCKGGFCVQYPKSSFFGLVDALVEVLLSHTFCFVSLGQKWFKEIGQEMAWK